MISSPKENQNAGFVSRHIGPRDAQIDKMLKTLEVKSLGELMDKTIPSQIRSKKSVELSPALSESELLLRARKLSRKNRVYKSYIGMGYSDSVTPTVIQRNIFENPGWYTQYTPYQSEIAQGRLEALLNFQTMVMNLTGFDIANSSLLDEATAAAEAMSFCYGLAKSGTEKVFLVSETCHPQTIEVVQTRAEPLGIKVEIVPPEKITFERKPFGVLVQYPDTFGEVRNYEALTKQAHDANCLVVAAADIMSLALFKPPGDWGADVAIGNTQRFGVPLGFGGPHAAYFATRDEYKRKVPGRIVGVAPNMSGSMAYRLSLQTREQHIRRDKATSNICTAQVLLAIMSSMYAVYHGPEGVRSIASRIREMTARLYKSLSKSSFKNVTHTFFDTIVVEGTEKAIASVLDRAEQAQVNLRRISPKRVGVSLNEVVTEADLAELASLFETQLEKSGDAPIPAELERKSEYLQHPVFNQHRAETQMLRYIKKLERRDLSLTQSMIPLGSCTMKLNATSEMYPVSFYGFSKLHPFVPLEQANGYLELMTELENDLAELTGFDGVSLQPNAGSQGEYAGLLVIRKYHESRGEGGRNICLIPQSAHGTNPASAVMAGMKVVVVKCDNEGNIDLTDLQAKVDAHKDNLSALMVTYPSTHGVFEESIKEICSMIHSAGGQVYLDGANLNAQIGICFPGEYGPDVAHLNLHKTFCIPHGGGGPGMGPIAVKAHLKDYLPGHQVMNQGDEKSVGAISAAPWGSPSILPISWAYIRMMGAEGLKRATEVAILNANYVARRLAKHYPILYKGKNGLVAHECIIDLRKFKASAGIEVDDIAKRLMDYGFHAPTVSWPVAGTMMIEPTESEDLEELDRFCDAMLSIHDEIKEIEDGKADKQNNVLKNAPHTDRDVMFDGWDRPYSREKAAFPVEWVKDNKFWPATSRINGAAGDRNLICSCPAIDAYSE